MKRLAAILIALFFTLPLMASSLSQETLAILDENIYEALNHASYTVDYYSRVESGEDYYNGVHDNYSFQIGSYDIQRNSSGDRIEGMYYYSDSFYLADMNVEYNSVHVEGTCTIGKVRYDFEIRSKYRIEDILVFTDYTVNKEISTDIPEEDVIIVNGDEYDLSVVDYPEAVEEIDGAMEAYEKLMRLVTEKYEESLSLESYSFERDGVSFTIENYNSDIFPVSYYIRGKVEGHEIVESFAFDTEEEYYGYTMIDGHFVN